VLGFFLRQLVVAELNSSDVVGARWTGTIRGELLGNACEGYNGTRVWFDFRGALAAFALTRVKNSLAWQESADRVNGITSPTGWLHP